MQKKIKAGIFIQTLTEPFGGKGGGRPSLAQAGISSLVKIDDFENHVYQALRKIASE